MGTPLFEEFVVARNDRLLRVAYLLTSDRGLAEDLVQTAYTKALPVWDRIEGDPEAYVRRILVNTYRSWWRRKWRGETPTEILPDEGVAGDQGQIADRESLAEALDRLSVNQRAALVLRFYEDLSEAETAEVLRCSRGTLKSWTSRALAKLRLDPALVDSYGIGKGDRA